MIADIEKAFDLSLKEANKLVYEHQLRNIISFCNRLVNDVLPYQREYKNQTGNTVTSYSFGVYYNGVNVHIGSNDLDPPIRTKLKKGESWSGINYDGEETDISGTIDTDGGYGEDTAYSFLKSYSPKTRSFSIVVCSGTEYSLFLEKVKHLNVLSDSIEVVSSEFLNSFKPMK
jgi:hypothetical protein